MLPSSNECQSVYRNPTRYLQDVLVQITVGEMLVLVVETAENYVGKTAEPWEGTILAIESFFILG